MRRNDIGRITAYDRVTGARSADRLCASRYIDEIVSDFTELHGDRRFGDDPAVIGGIGWIESRAVTVIGIEKGTTTSERIRHNFGSAHPEGYRKALRLMKQAEKFARPIVCFVDTAGAFCGVDAEYRGQGQAIAENLYEMSALRTPILSIVIGEGGSGGALALSHADSLWMLEDAYFSVVSPENCANILWKTTERAAEAAEALALTAAELKALNVIDETVPSIDATADKKSIRRYMDNLSADITRELDRLCAMNGDELLQRRYCKFRQIGY